MASCRRRGRQPRVAWRRFARVGRLRSARTLWCFSGVFKMENKSTSLETKRAFVEVLLGILLEILVLASKKP